MTEPVKHTVTLHISDEVAADTAVSSGLIAEMMEQLTERMMHPERRYYGPSAWVDEVELGRFDDVRVVIPSHDFRSPEPPVARVCIANGYEVEDVELTAEECRTEAAKLLAAAKLLDDQPRST